MKSIKTWFKGLALGGKIATISAVSILSLFAISSVSQPSSRVITTTPSSTRTVQQPKTETIRATATEMVAFTSSTVDDATLAQGTTQVRTAGVNGERTLTYEVTYTNGQETSRKEVANAITTQPVNEVIVKGTKAPRVQAQKSCPNGTYVNTAGNTVCSPYASDGVPAGATAQCQDGTYSYSQSRRGTCSHHGGVARWL